MAYKIQKKKSKKGNPYSVKNEKTEWSEAEVLNDIEMRIRKGKPVSDREVRLLVEGYNAFGVRMPKDISKKIGG